MTTKEQEKIFLRRTKAGFEPAYDRDADLLRDIPVGAVVSTVPKRPRNPRRLRWWWALLHKVAESHPFYSRAEQVALHLKYRTGHVEPVVIVKGDAVETHLVPQSIAYDAMTESEFRAFVDRALDVVVAELLPGIERDELVAEIEAMLGPEESKRRAA